jgi:transposase
MLHITITLDFKRAQTLFRVLQNIICHILLDNVPPFYYIRGCEYLIYNHISRRLEMGGNIDNYYLTGPVGSLAIKSGDNVARKLAMLFENICLGVSATASAKKYGFSRARFYQVKNAFREGGTEALIVKKRGPKKNYVRTRTVINQIMRYRFLNPDASASVIAQKMRQTGYKISQRSVERTITELGIQKKTPFVKSKTRAGDNRNTPDQTKD